jgi:hypothetical protein
MTIKPAEHGHSMTVKAMATRQLYSSQLLTHEIYRHIFLGSFLGLIAGISNDHQQTVCDCRSQHRSSIRSNCCVQRIKPSEDLLLAIPGATCFKDLPAPSHLHIYSNISKSLCNNVQITNPSKEMHTP